MLYLVEFVQKWIVKTIICNSMWLGGGSIFLIITSNSWQESEQMYPKNVKLSFQVFFNKMKHFCLYTKMACKGPQIQEFVQIKFCCQEAEKSKQQVRAVNVGLTNIKPVTSVPCLLL